MPLIAVPTTPSAGAEVSPYALFIDSNAKKKTLERSGELVPSIVIYDAGLLESIPKGTMGYFIFDILGHAIEGLVSRMSSVISDGFAVDAVRIIQEVYPRLVQPYPKDALQSLQRAGFLASIVQSTASVGMAHALGHYVGAAYGIPHAQSVALFLPEVVSLNAKYTDKYKKMALLGLADTEQLLQFFSAIKEQFGCANATLPSSIVLDDMVQAMQKDFCAPTNPYRWTKEDIQSVIEKLTA